MKLATLLRAPLAPIIGREIANIAMPRLIFLLAILRFLVPWQPVWSFILARETRQLAWSFASLTQVVDATNSTTMTTTTMMNSTNDTTTAADGASVALGCMAVPSAVALTVAGLAAM